MMDLVVELDRRHAEGRGESESRTLLSFAVVRRRWA